MRTAREDVLLHAYSVTREPLLKEELVRRLAPLARSLALRYRSRGEATEDLIQVANLGLVQAIERFDPSRGAAFRCYAVPTILGELRRHFRDRVTTMSLPRDLQECRLKVRAETASLSSELGRNPTVAELSERLGLDREQVIEALQADRERRAISLDESAGLEDAPPRVEAIGTEDRAYQAVEAQHVFDGLALDQDERELLHDRYVDRLTQDQVARRLGVSQMQVSRMQRRVLLRVLEAIRGIAA